MTVSVAVFAFSPCSKGRLVCLIMRILYPTVCRSLKSVHVHCTLKLEVMLVNIHTGLQILTYYILYMYNGTLCIFTPSCHWADALGTQEFKTSTAMLFLLHIFAGKFKHTMHLHTCSGLLQSVTLQSFVVFYLCPKRHCVLRQESSLHVYHQV